MALRLDLSTEVHLELERFQIVSSVRLSALQLKYWKGVKVGAYSKQSADWSHATAKGR